MLMCPLSNIVIIMSCNGLCFWIGITVRSHFPDESAEVIQNYAAQFTTLASKAKEVIRGIDPTNQLTFIRVRSKKHEIMIAPG